MPYVKQSALVQKDKIVVQLPFQYGWTPLQEGSTKEWILSLKSLKQWVS